MDDPHDWVDLLPDRADWPPELIVAVESGKYISWKHDASCLLLLSTQSGDQIVVRGGQVQARIAVDRRTGDVTRPSPDVSISQWEADLFGRGEEHRRRLESRQQAPIDLSEWNHFGTFLGVPKNKKA